MNKILNDILPLVKSRLVAVDLSLLKHVFQATEFTFNPELIFCHFPVEIGTHFPGQLIFSADLTLQSFQSFLLAHPLVSPHKKGSFYDETKNRH